MLKLLLLLGRQDSKLPLLLRVLRVGRPRSSDRRITRRKVILIVQCREHVLLSARPCVVVVVSDVDHVVRVYGTEGCESISYNGEESNKDTVNDVDDVDLLSTDIDPADKEEHPGQTKKGNECRVEGDKEPKCCTLSVTFGKMTTQILTSPNVLSETLQRALHLGSS